MAPVSVQLGLLTVATDPASPDLTAVATASERATSKGHRVVALHTVGDAEDEIRDQLTHWIDDPEIDVVIILGAESNAASTALKPLVTEVLPGFTDLFRWLMFQESGASAMLSSAEAARCGSTFVFVLPGAIAAAMDKLILPQFDPATTPRNLLGDMPRLRTDNESTADAVPSPIAIEKTEAGSGLPHRLPAVPASLRAKPRTGANLHVRAKAANDPPTKPIDLAGLEHQIAISNGHFDAVTKPHDLAKLLPRVPPGADAATEADDDFTDTEMLAAPELPSANTPAPVIAPPPPTAPTRLPSILRPAAASTPPAVVVKPPITTPTPTARPAASTPPATAKRPSAPSVRPPASIPPAVAKRPSSPSTAPTPTPIARPAASTPPAITKRPSAPSTAPTPTPTSDARPSTPSTPPTPTSDARPRTPSTEAIAPTPRAETPPPAPTPTTDALLAERDAALAAEAAIADEPPPPAVAAPSKPITEPPLVTPPAPRPRAPTPAPPLPVVAATPATRAPVEDPQRDLFAYPVKRRSGKLAMQILAGVCIAVIAAGAVIYVRDQTGDGSPREQVATSTPPPPADAAPAPLAPPPSPDASEPEPEIQMEPAPPPIAAPTPTPTRPTTPRTTTPATPRTRVATATPPETGSATPSTASPTPAPAADATVPVPAADGDCDETGCVLSKYEGACCAKYKPAGQEFKPRVGGVPESLDRTMIRAGVDAIKPRVVTCGEKANVAGTVKISVTVSADGVVSEASVVDSPDPALGACVAGAMRAAKFGKSVNGGSFTYPFVFGTSS